MFALSWPWKKPDICGVKKWSKKKERVFCSRHEKVVNNNATKAKVTK